MCLPAAAHVLGGKIEIAVNALDLLMLLVQPSREIVDGQGEESRAYFLSALPRS
jgi:hypothetical protein